MNWDMRAVVDDLRFALAAAEAIVFIPLGMLVFIALFSLGMSYINPGWREMRRQIEQRTDVPAESLDVLFKVVRNPVYTMFSVTSGLCLVVGVAGIVGGFGVLLYGLFPVNLPFFIAMGSAALLLGMFLVGSWFVVTGACHLTLARTVATEDCIGKLSEFEGERSEAVVDLPESRVRFYRWRGLKMFVISLLVLISLWMSGFGRTIHSSLDLMMDNQPASDPALSQQQAVQ